MPERQLVWAYAVIAGGLDEGQLVRLRGVDGEVLRFVRTDDLTAVVGSVDGDRYDQEGLKRSLNDLHQLELLARTHDAVVRQLTLVVATVPVRLATVYSDDDHVRVMLQQDGEALRAVLQRIAGRQEWGVKAYAVPASNAAEGGGPPESGTAYLRQRQASLNARESERRLAVAAAEDLHHRLGDVAAASRLHRPQDTALSGDRRWMVLNGAYLVAVESAEPFADAVSKLAGDHHELEVELTGPWPPYSFTAEATSQEPT